MPDIHYHGPILALDLDDTLYPEADFVQSAFRAIADALQRRDNLDPAATLKTMSRAARIKTNPFDALLDAFPHISHKELFIPLCVEIYRYHTPDISLPDESRRFLDEMRDKGIKMTLVTDGRAITQWAKIKALNLDYYISPADIWISEERGSGKLSLDPWRYIIDQYPEAKSLFYLGDNPAKDFLYPSMLGFHTIMLQDRGNNIHPQHPFPSDAHRPAVKLRSLPEIANYILEKID